MTRSLSHLIISISLLAGVLGLYAFWYYTVEKATGRSVALQAEIDKVMHDTVVAAETSDALTALATDEAAIKGYSIPLTDIVPFLERIEGTGRELGSAAEVVAVSDKPGADGRIVISLRILGSFDAVMRTLGAIEYGPYDSRIVNLTLDKPPTAGSAWTASASISVAVTEVPTKP